MCSIDAKYVQIPDVISYNHYYGWYGGTTDMNGEFFESMGNEEFNLPTTNGGHATAKNNVSGKQAYNYIRFTPTARRDKDPLDYTVAGSAWWNMSEIYLYRIRHDEAWARAQLGI